MNVMLYGTRAPDAGADTGVDAALAAELRMLCRGLAYSSFAILSAVRTVVRLPDDEASERALRQACAELAGEFGLESAVRWMGDAWAVCFSRDVPDEFAAPKAVHARDGWRSTRFARLARARSVLRSYPAGRSGRVRGRR